MNRFTGTCAGVLSTVFLLSAQVSESRTPIVLDSKYNVVRYYDIPVNLSLKRLGRLHHAASIGHQSEEGETYTTAELTLSKGIKIKIMFDRSGKLSSMKTVSPNAVAPKGIKVGSLLSAVRAAWPKGRLLYGIEEGRAGVTFITGTNVLISFDPNDMPAEAFRPGRKDIQIPNLRVRGIDISSGPVSIPNSCIPGYCL